MNNTQKLSPKEIFSFGFKNAKKYFWQFFGFFIVYMIFSLLSPSVEEGEMMTALQGLGLLVSFIGTIYLNLCLYNATIKIAREKSVTMKDFFTWPKNGFKAIWTGIIQMFALAPAMLFLILGIMLIAFSAKSSVILFALGVILVVASFIAYVYLAIRLYFSSFYSLETGEWAFPSIKKSWHSTKGRVWFLIWLSIITLGVILLGILAIFIGLLWAIPTGIIAFTFTYAKLFPLQHKESEIIVQPVEIPDNTEMNTEVVENNTNNQ